MTHYLSDKEVVVRKNHRCRICDELIKKGEKCHDYRGIEEGEGHFTSYFHLECWEYSRGWNRDDWEGSYPGDVMRREVIELLQHDKEAQKGNSHG